MITVDQTPDALIPYSGCMAWILDQDGPGPTEIKKLGYQIYNDGGDTVTAPEAVTVAVGTGVIIDPIRECRGALRTFLPAQDLEGVVKDTTATDNFQLAYWEQIFDITGTCDVTITAPSFTSFARVTRIAFQDWEEYDLALPLWLTKRPTVHRVCRSEHIMLSVWLPDDNYLVEVVMSGKGIPSETFGLGVASDGDIFHFSLPPSMWTNLAQADSITVEIQDPGGEPIADLEKFTFLLGSCKCCTDRQFAAIHFLEPLGGWSSLTFDCIDRNFQRRKNKFCVPAACDNGVLSRAGSGGNKSRDAGSVLSLVLKKKIRNIGAYSEFIEALLASNEMYLTLSSATVGINVVRVGFNLEDARVVTLPEEDGLYQLELTGSMFKTHKTLNQ